MSDSPSHKKQKLDHAAVASLAVSPAAAPFQLLSQLPLDLLAQVASHLPVAALLVLQRASHTQAALRADESYMAEAWSSAKVALDVGSKLPGWTLPLRQCVHSGQQQLIPVHVWRAALPALQAAVAKRQDDDKDERRRQQHQQLRQWVEQPHPTRLVYVKRNDKNELCVVEDASAQPSGDAQGVEVLSDIDRKAMWDCTPQYRDVEVRCRLVLRACPYLQQFVLAINTAAHVEPSHEDTFALLPQLRSLDLILRQPSQQESELLIEEPPVDFERLLDSLPRLTSLRCYDIFLGVSDLLDIAAHSTLEELFLKAAGKQLSDASWIGEYIAFPIAESRDELELQQAAAGATMSGGLGVEEAAPVTGSGSAIDGDTSIDREQGPAWTRDDVRRMQAALTRTQPTRRSCKMRLALADWLHRRLRRSGLHTDADDHPAWLLRHYRSQVELLRSMLRRQLGELASLTTSTAAERRRSERVDELQLIYSELQHRWTACWLAWDRLKSLSAEQQALAGRLPGMSEAELRIAALTNTRLAGEIGAMRQRARDMDSRQWELMERVEALLQESEAAEEGVGEEFEALLAEVLEENGHHQPWIEKALGPRKRTSCDTTPR